MYRRVAFRVTGAAAAASGLLLAVALTSSAVADAQPPDPSGSDHAVDVPAGMLDALESDLGLDAAQAEQVLAEQAAASDLGESLREDLGPAYAGAVFDPASGQLTVSVADPAAVEAVSAAGAVPKLVAYSAGDLDAIADQVQQTAAASPDLTGVHGWRVDPSGNSVVLGVDPAALSPAAADFVARARTLSPAVVTEAESDPPRTYADLVGGDAFHIDGTTRCSIGFSVDGGFVTAGHCGSPGSTTTSPDGTPQGSFQGSSFPGNDYAWVATDSSWTPQPAVRAGEETVAVNGSQPAVVGAAVCRSGSTTGWHCGQILALNQTVVYPDGTVYGLTRTDVCAEPGDSGGSFISGDQAQGVTSGGSGDCTRGGVTYFQPVNEILAAYGLRLAVANA